MKGGEQKMKEIKKVKELGAEAASVMVGGELKDLKQKLRQLINEFPDINDEKYRFSGQEFMTDTYPMFIWDVFRWKQKFEELLKEEKEAR
jgi:hypothetical protein